MMREVGYFLGEIFLYFFNIPLRRIFHRILIRKLFQRLIKFISFRLTGTNLRLTGSLRPRL